VDQALSSSEDGGLHPGHRSSLSAARPDVPIQYGPRGRSRWIPPWANFGSTNDRPDVPLALTSPCGFSGGDMVELHAKRGTTFMIISFGLGAVALAGLWGVVTGQLLFAGIAAALAAFGWLWVQYNQTSVVAYPLVGRPRRRSIDGSSSLIFYDAAMSSTAVFTDRDGGLLKLNPMLMPLDGFVEHCRNLGVQIEHRPTGFNRLTK
jgi:hypothetical protein